MSVAGLRLLAHRERHERRVSRATSLLGTLGTINVPEGTVDFLELLGRNRELLDECHENSMRFAEFTGIDPQEAFNKSLTETHCELRWASHGMPIFDVTSSLAAMLVLTDVPDMLVSELVLPFPTFAIRPPPDLLLRAGEGTGPVRLIWAHRSIHQGSNASGDNVQLMAEGEGSLSMDSTVLGSSSTTKWIYRNKYPDDARMTLDPTVRAIEAAAVNCMVSVKRLFVNLCLWMVSPESDARRVRRPSKRADDPEVELGVPDIWVVGRSVKLSKELLSSARALVESESGRDRAPWKLARRFTVRGHWRNQACGPERRERRRIQIRPFWKGPRSSVEALVRGYRVESKK